MQDMTECLNGHDETGCAGRIEYRAPLSGSGKSFPRCAKHWQLRLRHEEGLRRRYPTHAPSDWSPYDSGEAWDEGDY